MDQFYQKVGDLALKVTIGHGNGSPQTAQSILPWSKSYQ